MSRQPHQSDVIRYFSDTARQFTTKYDHSVSFRERESIWQTLMDQHVLVDGSALDLGCGSGLFSFYLAGKGMQVTAIDAAEQMISLCMQRKRELQLENIRFIKSELPGLSGVNVNKVDLIICSSVLEYVENLDTNLELIAGLLNKRGILIVSLPNAYCLNRLYQRLKFRLKREPEIYSYIRHFATPHSLKQKLRGLGLVQLALEYYDHPFRVSRLTRRLGLPPVVTGDLFAAVFRKE